MYGSIFWSVTRKPRASSSEPMEADAKPLPSDDTTPPVTKMYFVATSSLLPGRKPVSHILDFSVSVPGRAVESTALAQRQAHRQRVDARRRRAREAIARIEQPKDTRRPQPPQRDVGASVVQDPLQLRGEALAGEGRIRAEAQGQRLTGRRPAVEGQPESRGIARAAEHARGIVDEGQRMQDAQ